MTQQEIQERNQQIALMLGLYHDEYVVIFSDMMSYTWDNLKFHKKWNWLMEAVEFICNNLGHRKYSYSHEDHSRCVFTDMAILHQTHDFGGGNIVIDSGTQNTEKEAVFIAVSDFAKLYNENKI
jgi:hypothetical protein